ncbi:hypothetical protein U1Q18_025260 [Sarracenia purpurea var. burkii]
MAEAEAAGACRGRSGLGACRGGSDERWRSEAATVDHARGGDLRRWLWVLAEARRRSDMVVVSSHVCVWF